MTNNIIPQESQTSGIFSRPENIAENHWQEWLDSCVKPQIIEKNVSTIYDSRKLDEILNRNSKRRHKHSTDLVPAWVVSGVDPLSGERWLSGVQCKPDKPPIKDGKPLKYTGASGYGVSPLFLELEDDEYWQKILNDTNQSIIITEGAKKSGCLLSANHAAISIPGVSTCRKKGRLHDLLKAYCTYGRTVYLCFDNDVITKRQVQLSLINLSRDIAANGAKVMIMEIPQDAPKGIDDYVAQEGYEIIDEIIKNAKTIEEWKEDLDNRWQLEQGRIQNSCRSKLAGHYKILEDIWGDNLRFNELKNTIEMNGEPINLEGLRLEISLNFDFDMSLGDAINAVERLGKINSYHPVKEYLEECIRMHPSPQEGIIDNIAQRYFQSSDPLHNAYLKKTLIAAVARIMEPGCQHDAVTVLVGRRHGIGKSSFWRELFGSQWFSDQIGEATKSEDDIQTLHKFWGLEYSEIESIYKKKDVASFKKFVSARTDVYRASYARTSKEHPRRSVLVGSSNEEEILTDPTGNRRFWLIPVKNMVPLQDLISQRDEMWAAAYLLYKSGASWELSDQEKQAQAIQNENYQQVDAWEFKIQSFLEQREEFFPEDLYDYLKIETPHQNDMVARRIAKILKNLNWDKERRRYGKYRRLVWVEQKAGVSQDTNLVNFDFFESLQNNRDNRDNRDKNENHLNFENSKGSSDNNAYVIGTESGQNRDKLEPLPDNIYNNSINNKDILIGTEPGQARTPDIAVFKEDRHGKSEFVPIEKESGQQHENTNLVAQDTPLSTQWQLHPSFKRNKTNTFHVEGITGRWVVDYLRDREEMIIMFTSPDGKQGQDSIPITQKTKYEIFKEIVCGCIWETERAILKGREFKVKIITRDTSGEYDYQWIQPCELLRTPAYPTSRLFYFRHGDRHLEVGSVAELKLIP